ncbi:unnamed protein product [Clavelina lepadiformis]|uniref:Ribosomal protein S18 n=1 Tax=Clavelina lepadiformis TaxID=159417 RepID=A0ABP0FYK9_CLALP
MPKRVFTIQERRGEPKFRQNEAGKLTKITNINQSHCMSQPKFLPPKIWNQTESYKAAYTKTKDCRLRNRLPMSKLSRQVKLQIHPSVQFLRVPLVCRNASTPTIYKSSGRARPPCTERPVDAFSRLQFRKVSVDKSPIFDREQLLVDRPWNMRTFSTGNCTKVYSVSNKNNGNVHLLNSFTLTKSDEVNKKVTLVSPN